MSGDSKARLRLWIALLSLTRRAEGELREFLRRDFGSTLPRFDVMAALWRAEKPMSMTEISRRLLVSNGNVTTVVDRLETDGLVRRAPCETDRRAMRVELTEDGRAAFARMAEAHESEIDRLLGRLTHDEMGQMRMLLSKLGSRA